MAVNTAPTLGDDTLIGDDSNDFIDGLAGDDRIEGRGGHDTLIGGDGRDWISGGDGNDRIDSSTGDTATQAWGDYVRPGLGNDTVLGHAGLWAANEGTDLSYGDLGSDLGGVTITVTDGATGSGTVTGANGQVNDTFTYIHYFEGSQGDDFITGGTADRWEGFAPLGGDDTIDGGGLTDANRVDYSYEVDYFNGQGSGVVVDLFAGTATDTQGGNDTLININMIRGTQMDDFITAAGVDHWVWLEGEDGDDTLQAGNNDGGMEGGDGDDTYIYAFTGDHVIRDTGGTDNLELFVRDENGDPMLYEMYRSGDDLVILGRPGLPDLVIEGAFTPDGRLETLTYRSADGRWDGIPDEFFTPVILDAADPLIDQNSLIIGSVVDDLLIAGTGDYNDLYGHDGNDTLLGSDNSDWLYGGTGNDDLQGGEGNDVLDDGRGFDTVNGGPGNDTLRRDLESQFDTPYSFVPVVDLANGLLYVQSDPSLFDELISIENVTLIGEFHMSITGDDGGNRLESDAGNDTIDGAGGDDYISGGNGNDDLQGGSGDDTITDGGGYDTIDGGDGIDLFTRTYGGEFNFLPVIDLAEGRIYAQSAPDDFEIITGIENTEHLGLQHHTIIGNGVDNHIVTGGGDDTIESGQGNDTVLSGDGADDVKGGNGDDLIEGGGGHDLLRGGKDVDTILGGDGNDVIRGQSHADITEGGAGDDNVKGGGGNDTVRGDDGNDFVKGGSRRDLVEGGDGDDKLFGNSFNDTLDGGAGNDTLKSGGDDDILIGGADDDFLKGGSGNDVFVFDIGHGSDRIVDWTDGDNMLEVSSALAGGLDAAGIEAAAQVTADGVEISLAAGDVILIEGLEDATGLAAQIDIV